jgi:hypothetical protein
MRDMSIQTMHIPPGDRVLIRATLTTSEDITGWTVEARFATNRSEKGEVIADPLNIVALAIESVVNKTFTATLTPTQSLAFALAQLRACDFWRTNAGSESLRGQADVSYTPVVSKAA